MPVEPGTQRVTSAHAAIGFTILGTADAQPGAYLDKHRCANTIA